MMVRHSSSVGYKGKLTNDNTAFSIGSGSLTAHRVPDSSPGPNKSATSANYPIHFRKPIKYASWKGCRKGHQSHCQGRQEEEKQEKEGIICYLHLQGPEALSMTCLSALRGISQSKLSII